jgi:hypothetical protein
LVLLIVGSLLPMWSVRGVQVEGDFPLPAAVRRSLATMTGTPVALLDLGWVRAHVESWPGVSSVEVALELPATLRVVASRAVVEASRPVGRGWHAVAADGSLAGPLAGPQPPVLEGFAPRADELLMGLEVARRLERSSGCTVESVRRVTPTDCRVSIRFGDAETPVMVHVLPRETEAERFWCRQVQAGPPPAGVADLRSERRLVVARPPAPSGTPTPEGEPDSESGEGPA